MTFTTPTAEEAGASTDTSSHPNSLGLKALALEFQRPAVFHDRSDGVVGNPVWDLRTDLKVDLNLCSDEPSYVLHHFLSYLAGVPRQPRWVKGHRTVEASRFLGSGRDRTGRPSRWLGATSNLSWSGLGGTSAGWPLRLLGGFVSLHLFGRHV